ncbi:MAG: hypothetical protein IKZ58_06395 [Selenomonadaceae bacterium]|nr:hypothetical protein [Selenomonadaceae bacterium]
MIKPLPVKKNKFGQRVADISITDYYGQIMEEVLEAHTEFVSNSIYDKLNGEKIIGDDDNEAEELVDIITCCVTRLHIIGGKYYDTTRIDKMEENFYRQLANQVLVAFNDALYTEIHNYKPHYEQFELSAVIKMCVTRLESLGYDESARQNLYAAVNDKNQKRGYFEE